MTYSATRIPWRIVTRDFEAIQEFCGLLSDSRGSIVGNDYGYGAVTWTERLPESTRDVEKVKASDGHCYSLRVFYEVMPEAS